MCYNVGVNLTLSRNRSKKAQNAPCGRIFCEEHSPAPCGRHLHNSFDLRPAGTPPNFREFVRWDQKKGAFWAPLDVVNLYRLERRGGVSLVAK